MTCTNTARMNTTDIRSESTSSAPTSYKICRRERYEYSWWMWWLTLVLIPIIAGLFLYSINNKPLILSLWTSLHSPIYVVIFAAGSIYYGNYLYTIHSQIRDVEIIVTICPLGIQRSKKTITTRTTIVSSTVISNKNANIRTSVHYYQLLPLESVKDCIVLEHVGAFSLKSVAMVRVIKKTAQNNDDVGSNNKDDNATTCSSSSSTTTTENKSKNTKLSELVSVFPDATLSFDQCHLFVTMINNVLNDYRM